LRAGLANPAMKQQFGLPDSSARGDQLPEIDDAADRVVNGRYTTGSKSKD